MKNVDFKIKGKDAAFYDVSGYSRIPDGEFLQKYINSIFKETNLENAKIGDLILFRFKDAPQHVAMISETGDDGVKIIHCYMQARGVVEHFLDEYWLERVVGVYDVG